MCGVSFCVALGFFKGEMNLEVETQNGTHMIISLI